MVFSEKRIPAFALVSHWLKKGSWKRLKHDSCVLRLMASLGYIGPKKLAPRNIPEEKLPPLRLVSPAITEVKTIVTATCQ